MTAAISDRPGTAWSGGPADLVRRVARALDVAAAAIDLLVDGDAPIDLAALEAPEDKVIAETAMFLRSVAALPGGQLRGRALALAGRLAPAARSRRVRLGIALHPALARDHAAAHVVLAAAGLPDPELDAELRTGLAARTAAARERLPHRELEQAWLGHLAGGPAPAAGLVARTALASGVDVLTGSRDDVYALTHALLYASDFGLRAVPAPPRPAAEILAEVRALLVGALDDDDFDLAGELLLSWPFLGEPFDGVASWAFGVLSTVEDEVGLLPSLATDGAAFRAQPPAARAHYAAATAYHPALVMGLLCTAILRTGSLPGRWAAAGPPVPLEVRRQWQRSGPPPAGVARDVALRRAVRRGDLGAVRELLRADDEPAGLIAVECARLLARIAAAAG